MIEFKVFLNQAFIHKIQISKNSITIGRSPDNDIILPNPHISRLQGVITQEGNSIKLVDKSRNGILLDNKRIPPEIILPPYCRLTLYPYELECIIHSEEETISIPLPMNPSTKIEFGLPETADVRFTIYNALGQKVTELVNTRLDAGRYSYEWNAGSNASGIYIYELRTNKFVSVKKMILIK